MSRSRLARVYAALVGTMDLATGLALLVAPTYTLLRLGAAAPAPEANVFVRFIGVFVGLVGASYLRAVTAGPQDFRAMLSTTLLFRLGAGLYTGLAVTTGHFGPAWLIVSVTDLSCALIQGFLLMKGVDRHA